VHGSYSAGFQLYKLNPDGSGEAPGSTSYNNLEPAIYRSMLNEFVDWEATLSKPTNTTNFSFNRFDAFRYRQNDATAGNWRDGGIWADDASPATFVTMMREDSYANAALVFQPRNDASYTSNNNISRSTGLYYPHIDNGLVNPAGLIEFMLNELRFDGQFTGATNLSGTLTGYPLLFVKNLNGVNPKIRLNNSSSVASNFAFNVNMDVVLHDNLEITGDSAQPFVINGQIRDFDEAMSLTKSGLSAITLTGNNTYKGATIVNRGTLRIDGPSAVLANTSSVQIGPQGTLTLAAGRIRTNSVQIEAGGTFNFLGGILETPSITGNLAVNGGTFRPGLSPAMTTISLLLTY
jgi:autotransporter-associated beta strand protein